MISICKRPSARYETGDWRSLLQSSRPALMLSYVVNQRMSGFEPFAFHLTNILLHVLNAILLWRFLLALFSNAQARPDGPGAIADLGSASPCRFCF